MKILVADYDAGLLKVYKIFLMDQGHEVVTARDGKECIDLYRIFLAGDGFDLVILDYRMPERILGVSFEVDKDERRISVEGIGYTME